MKTVVLIVCFFAVAALARERELPEMLAGTFKISTEEAKTCLKRTKADLNDFQLFEEELNVRVSHRPDKDSVRRATCTLTCVAQVTNLMLGSKLQMGRIHDIINSHPIPEETKKDLHESISDCGEQVKGTTDECDVSLQFLKCIIEKQNQWT